MMNSEQKEKSEKIKKDYVKGKINLEQTRQILKDHNLIKKDKKK